MLFSVIVFLLSYNIIELHAAQLPKTCNEAVGRSGKSGMYQIQIPDSEIRPFFIFCQADPNGGPAWAIIQRRLDGTIDFYRNWADYKNGFGNIAGEYFIGLDIIYELTNAASNELWIQMEDFENQTRHAMYDRFAIGNAKQDFALNVLGKFSGDAGDSLTVHAGEKWSTKDVQNDNNPNNCAQLYKGAWWYHLCHQSNLNGLYLRGTYPEDKFAQGVNWNAWHGFYYSLKYTHMAIRWNYK